MEIVNEIVVWIILILSSISTVMLFADSLGFLPKESSLRINKKRNLQVLELLKDFGVDYERNKRAVIASDIISYAEGADDLEKKVSRLLEKLEIKGKMEVGKTETVTVDCYIDLMGATTNPQIAEKCARYLSTYWKYILRNKDEVQNADFDFVITPKLGSPVLGYEFAKLIDKPFVLYSDKDKFGTSIDMFKKNADTTLKDLEGKAIIVDDSTTGGGKVIEIAGFLRKNGILVTDCLVVFEPTVKNVKKTLQDASISLHSIIKVDREGTQRE